MKCERIDPIFIGHGSPMNAILRNRYAKFLREYAESIPRPKAILVISAHWQTEGTLVTARARPGQIYDFYGFPDELYAISYAPDGAPDLAASLAECVGEISPDPERGIDHAAWAPVSRMYPDADVPLVELSLDLRKGEREHFALGEALRPLADEGILVMGSGNVVHNLRDVDFSDGGEPFPWAREADGWIADRVAAGDIEALIDYRRAMPNWRRAIPTAEHYLPLLTVLGMRSAGGAVKTLYEEIQNGSVSMRSIAVS